MMGFLLATIAAALPASIALTGAVRRYALRGGLLDHPNERSSHTRPTPRGGGVAIVASFLVGVLVLGRAGLLQASLCFAVVGAGALIATLGFVDDRRPLRASWRFAGHVVAAAWVLTWLGPIPLPPIAGVTLNLGVAAAPIAALYVIWSINLFNFMDGIDAIASVEAISVALGGALCWWIGGSRGDWAACVLLAACVAGFLVWNFPPAKIFMGDAGSGFLGLVVALLSLWSAKDTPHLLWSWLILTGCFMVDATVTLVRRVLRGEKFYIAHRSHAYQYAARQFASHRKVSLTVAAINAGWLLPIALLVAAGRVGGAMALPLAYAPLLWLALHFKAGDRAGQEG